MRINHNIASLNTYRQLTVNNANSSKSIEKLSSGLRINRAGDDAAGLAISEKMRGQIRGLDQASRNSQDAISMIQTAEGALNETHSILQRMRELAVQASNDTNTVDDRQEIQKEINQLTSEINRIGNTTEFNTKKLLNGERSNTLTTWTTGNYGSAAGASTAALTSGTGVSNVSFTGSSLTAGTKTLTISKTAEDRDETVTGLSGVTTVSLTGSSISGAQKLIISRTAEDRNETASGAGINTVTLNGATLSGTQGIKVRKVAENLVDQNVTAADVAYAGGLDSTKVTFAGNSIKVCGTDYNDSGDIVLDFNVNASGTGTVTIKACGTSGIVNDTIDIVGGALNYNNFGLKFNLTGITASGSITVSGAGGAAKNFGVVQEGYNVANSGGNDWFSGGSVTVGTPSVVTSSGTALPAENITWNIILSGASGASGFRVSGKGSSVLIQDSFAVDLTSDGFTYSANGISFSLKAGGTGGANDKITFTTTPKYTWEAQLSGAGGWTNIATGKSGAATVTASGLDLGGVEFSSAGLSEGTSVFTVSEVKQSYTYKAVLSGVASGVISSGVDSGATLTASGFSVGGIRFSSSDVKVGSGTFNIAEPIQSYTWKATVNGVASGVIGSGKASGETVTASNFNVGGVRFSSSGLSVGSSNFTVFTSGSSGSDLSLDFQIGANENQSLSLDISDMRATALGISSDTSGGDYSTSGANVTDGTNNTKDEFALNVTTVSGATSAITSIDNAIKTVSQERSKLGAVQNRLEHTIFNLGTASENLTSSESRIRDVDMAKEMMEFTKNNILTQAAQAMLAQANQQPQGVLQLLR